MKTRNIQQCHLSKARDFRKCSFHLVSLVFGVSEFWLKNVIQKTKGRGGQTKKTGFLLFF